MSTCLQNLAHVGAARLEQTEQVHALAAMVLRAVGLGGR
jgi:hypothetical protein